MIFNNMFKKYTVLAALALLAACDDKQPLKTAPKVRTFDEIVTQASCMACHQAGSPMKFPTWQEIARKYKEDKDAEVFLTRKIADGGSGSWGKMDMPPYPELSEAERRVVARGILSAAKDR